MRDAHEVALGRWRGILPALGIEQKYLRNLHGPCPHCGGKDRFRFDDKGGRGTFYCSQCGAGTGFDLLMRVHGWDFKTAAHEVAKVAGDFAPSNPRPVRDEARVVEDLREAWRRSRPVVGNDVVDHYLRSRGVGLDVYPPALRTCEKLPYREGNKTTYMPAMLALVTDREGVPVTLHRTYLKHDGSGKADIESPRKLMAGSLLRHGSCIRLGEPLQVADNELVVGVSEGIETALAASKLFQVPVWSLINSTIMSQWKPPAEISTVRIFGDNDPKFGGQKATYTLAHKLAVDHFDVKVVLPDEAGVDWNDILRASV